MSGYTKLFNSIVTSTIWQESPVVCKVWITMLALADRDGVIEGSIPGLAHLANVSIPEAETAIEKFMAPDRYSRSPESDGRRIEQIEGGWRLVNYEKYREKMSPEDIRERDRRRKQRWRDRKAKKCPTLSGTKRDKSEMSAKSNIHKAESIKQKSEEPDDCSTDNFDGSEWALRTAKAYPLWKDPDAQGISPIIGNLYMETIEREAPARGGNLPAAEWLLARVVRFRETHKERGTDPQFIPSLKNFLADGVYATVEMPAIRKHLPVESDEDCERRLREESRERRRAVREVGATL